jgi:hypothetical protein
MGRIRKKHKEQGEGKEEVEGTKRRGNKPHSIAWNFLSVGMQKEVTTE